MYLFSKCDKNLLCKVWTNRKSTKITQNHEMKKLSVLGARYIFSKAFFTEVGGQTVKNGFST